MSERYEIIEATKQWVILIESILLPILLIGIILYEPKTVDEIKTPVMVPTTISYTMNVDKMVVIQSNIPTGTVSNPNVSANEIKREAELYLDEEDKNLIALITMAEAEGQSELGQRLVIDTILNRLDSDRFPNTVHEVIYAPNQFACVWNGRVKRCYVMPELYSLVEEELLSRTNREVIFFRSGHYSSSGVPLLQEGDHYFSSLKGE